MAGNAHGLASNVHELTKRGTLAQCLYDKKTYFITNNDKKHNSSMDRIHDLSFGGERPLFGAHDVKLENITVTDL